MKATSGENLAGGLGFGLQGVCRMRVNVKGTLGLGFRV